MVGMKYFAHSPSYSAIVHSILGQTPRSPAPGPASKVWTWPREIEMILLEIMFCIVEWNG